MVRAALLEHLKGAMPNDRHVDSLTALRKGVLECPGTLSSSVRRGIYDGRPLEGPLAAFLEEVRNNAAALGRPDIDFLKGAGHSEDEILEATLAAALGAADRMLQAGLAALEHS